ncbi:MAG: hypothetical protein IPM29_30830 [Planctomycetes bacterium]|nr:hypothetical protein [Planctomycetota bacterium]
MNALLLPIVVPLLAGVLALLVPPAWRAWRAVIGALGAVAGCAVSWSIVGSRAGFAVAGFAVGPLPLDVVLRADGFSGWAVGFAATMALLCAVYSIGWYRERGGAPGHHYAWMLIASSGAATVLLADQLLLLVVGWEVVTLCLFLLVIGGRAEGSEGAAKAFVMLGLGDLALLCGVVLIALSQQQAGVERPLEISALRAAPLGTSSGPLIVAWLLLFSAAIAKAGAMPLHTWIPTMAKGSNPVVMAFLPGSIDKVLGIYLLARISLDWFETSAALRMVVMSVGVVTMLGAVFMAMIQHDLRRLLAYHAVSQVGYMLLGIGTGTVIGVIGGVFHMLNHAIYKACLFLGAGSVERETGTADLARLGGLGRTFPVTFACMFVAALAISGIPPLNGFASKWLVYQGCVAADQPLFLVAAVFGSALTLASFVKVLHSVFCGPRAAHLGDARETSSPGVLLPLGTLAAACVLLGVLPGAVLDGFVGPVVGLAPDGAVSGASALQGDPATWLPVGAPPEVIAAAAPRFAMSSFAPWLVAGLLLGVAVVAAFAGSLGRSGAPRVRPTFIGGEALDRERHRFVGTGFYRTVEELPVLRPVFRRGERGGFDPYEVSIGFGRPVVALLRRLHSGVLTDYCAWCFAGTAVLFVALLFGR